MTITQRFTLLVKGSFNAVLDSIEDPERSLNQLVLDMEEELEAAKRAAARAMANEDRLRARIAYHAQDADDWRQAAERALAKGSEGDAREALRRHELAARQRDVLARQLEAQARDTGEVREAVARMGERVGEARARLALLQARIRQGEARRAMSRVMQGVESSNLYGEFGRLGERVEEMAASERAYQRLEDEASGADVKRRLEAQAIDDAVEKGLAALRARLAASDPAPAAADADEQGGHA